MKSNIIQNSINNNKNNKNMINCNSANIFHRNIITGINNSNSQNNKNMDKFCNN
jgi:hypothetical protein